MPDPGRTTGLLEVSCPAPALREALKVLWTEETQPFTASDATVLMQVGAAGFEGMPTWLSRASGAVLVKSLPFLVPCTRYLALARMDADPEFQAAATEALERMQAVLPRYHLLAGLTSLRKHRGSYLRYSLGTAEFSVWVSSDFLMEHSYSFELELDQPETTAPVRVRGMRVAPAALDVLQSLFDVRSRTKRAEYVGVIEAECFEEVEYDWRESYEQFTSSWPSFASATLIEVRHDPEAAEKLKAGIHFSVDPHLDEQALEELGLSPDQGERAVALHNSLLHLWGFPVQKLDDP